MPPRYRSRLGLGGGFSGARDERGLPIVKPVGPDLMGDKRGKAGILGHLIKQRSAEGAVTLIAVALDNLDNIFAGLSGLQSAPALDGGFFRHPLVIRETERQMTVAAETSVFGPDIFSEAG